MEKEQATDMAGMIWTWLPVGMPGPVNISCVDLRSALAAALPWPQKGFGIWCLRPARSTQKGFTEDTVVAPACH